VPEVDPMKLLTGAQAALLAGVSVNVIGNWRRRGRLPVATDDQGNELRDGQGRRLYRLGDVARADAQTAKRAEAMALSLLARRAPAIALPPAATGKRRPS
jgi:hypothetical protein